MYGGWILDLWRWVKIATVAVGSFLAFAALIECVQAYQVLHNVHPYLGLVFVLALLALVGWGGAFFTMSMLRRPVVLVPPPAIDLDHASSREIRHHARYLIAVMERFADNPYIPAEPRALLLAEAGTVRSRLAATHDPRELVPVMQLSVDRVLKPVIAPLDAEANRRVRNCVRDTMLGVTVSPWRSMDLLVVLYRNGQMILEVSRLYHGRPRLRDQLRIFGDVMKIAATVQFLNIGSKLIENLTSWIPVLGRFADDIAQGIGAGLFTSVTGYATIDRCRSFQGWDEAAAREGVGSHLRQFLADLKGVVSDTIMPALRSRIEASTPVEKRGPNLMNRVRSGVSEAIDRTCETLDTGVRKPVEVGYRGVTGTGAVLWGGGRRVVGGTAWLIRKAGGQVWKVAADSVRGAERLTKRLTRRK